MLTMIIGRRLSLRLVKPKYVWSTFCRSPCCVILKGGPYLAQPHVRSGHIWAAFSRSPSVVITGRHWLYHYRSQFARSCSVATYCSSLGVVTMATHLWSLEKSQAKRLCYLLRECASGNEFGYCSTYLKHQRNVQCNSQFNYILKFAAPSIRADASWVLECIWNGSGNELHNQSIWNDHVTNFNGPIRYNRTILCHPSRTGSGSISIWCSLAPSRTWMALQKFGLLSM